jgi:hypothetical protein
MRYLKQIEKETKAVISIHIPKTAGTSIAGALIAQGFVELPFVEKYSLVNVNCKLRGIHRPSKHAKARDIKLAIGNKNWEKYFTFAIVRNPWDLMVSSYNWWLQKGNQWEKMRQDVDAIRKMNFSEFIQSRYGSQMINEQYGCLKDWICDANGMIMVDFVGKFENLADDWAFICKQLGLEQSDLPHANKTKRSAYREYYDCQSKEIIERRFAWAIQKFGYEF